MYKYLFTIIQNSQVRNAHFVLGFTKEVADKLLLNVSICLKI